MSEAHRFPDTLRRLRENEGLSQQEIAEILDTTSSCYRRLEGERANPSLQMLENLELTLGWSIFGMIYSGENAIPYLPLEIIYTKTQTVIIKAKTQPLNVPTIFTESNTLDSAILSIRSAASSYLLSYAVDGENPLPHTYYGIPPVNALILSEKLLFPILLRYLRGSETQTAIAEKAGVSLSAYRRFEHFGGNLSWATLGFISKVFGVDFFEMIHAQRLYPDMREKG